ncbi:hypothetical protein SAMN05428944_0066 [Streptomyces sp. 1222.5]|uniref:hypothetical protein n=1 Tax=unclassified Streptomyces TaxID=2593676 RepID=UPI00089D5279|nr:MULTISPECIES: hypothetical protein [unclassified Streptomyces]PKW05002.1 hypothetical protein BX260_0063 [Streptomyces sp. 5112.2]SEB53123.1 hypothetical protein SAMN05428944_0066 [Streptomyces sp. 1222.5]SEB97669.1 hypothetical protein SAMN05216532_0078 [Streptomyces sp. 2231.1]
MALFRPALIVPTAEAQGADAMLVGSFPTDDGRGWIALGRQDAYSSIGISVYAVSANR